MGSTGRRVPVMAQVTIEAIGTMLLGSEIAAALTSLEPFGIDVIGMNCATGPKQMAENVRYLCHAAPIPVSVIPNAGLPENVGGHAVALKRLDIRGRAVALREGPRRQHRRRVLRNDARAHQGAR